MNLYHLFDLLFLEYLAIQYYPFVLFDQLSLGYLGIQYHLFVQLFLVTPYHLFVPYLLDHLLKQKNKLCLHYL